MRNIFNRLAICLFCFCALFLWGCSKPTESSQPVGKEVKSSEPSKAPKATPVEEEEEPPADEIPVADDFLKEVQKEIDKENYLTVLESMEKEIAADAKK